MNMLNKPRDVSHDMFTETAVQDYPANVNTSEQKLLKNLGITIDSHTGRDTRTTLKKTVSIKHTDGSRHSLTQNNGAVNNGTKIKYSGLGDATHKNLSGDFF